jgi:predicted site-specific integrase-resolvase
MKTAILHPEALLDASEVCAILGISRRTLYSYTHVYKGRPIILSSIQHRGKTMFRRQTIEAYMAGHETKGAYKRKNRGTRSILRAARSRVRWVDKEIGSSR